MSFISEIALNQQIVESLRHNSQVKRYRTYSWQRNKDKLDFLGLELQNTLAKAFGMAEEFNREIDAARKYKSSSYLVGIPANKLREPFAKGRQGLEEWFQSNSGQAQVAPRRSGLFS